MKFRPKNVLAKFLIGALLFVNIGTFAFAEDKDITSPKTIP